MPRTEEDNKRLREAQRTKILDSARNVFAKKGLTATMSDIAIAADISQGLAYRYFPSKEMIFKELIEHSLQAGLSLMQSIFEMSGTPSERIRLLVSRILEKGYESLELHQLYIFALKDESIQDDLRDMLLNQSKKFHDLMRQLIIEGQASREVVKGDPDQLVIVISICLDGLSKLALHQSEQFKKYSPYTEIILRMLKS